MAFEFRLSDTSPRVGQAALSPGSAGGVSPTRTYTPESIGVAQGVNVAQTPFSQRPKFSTGENIQGLPARQDPPGPGITLSGGRRGQGSTGSDLGNSIQGLANKFAKAIRGTGSSLESGPATGAFSALGFETSGPRSTGFGSFTGRTGSVPTTPIVTSPPVSDAGAFIGALKDGGFIRKRT